MSGLMTIPEAAAWLGMGGRTGEQRLRRRLFALERERGKPIMLRRGSGASKRYGLTEPILRAHLPGWCPPADDWLSVFTREIGDLGQRRQRLDERLDRLSLAMGALEREIECL